MGRERVFVGEEFNPNKLDRTLRSIVRRINKSASIFIPPIPVSFGSVVSKPDETKTFISCAIIPIVGTITALSYRAIVPSGSKPTISIDLETKALKQSVSLDVKNGFYEASIGIRVTEPSVVTIYTSESFDFAASLLFQPDLEESATKSLPFKDIIDEVGSDE